MRQYKIAFMVGSLRRDSINRKLINGVMKLAPEELVFGEIKIDDLPLYNQDEEMTPSAQVQRLKSEIKAADALMFVTPEYNRSVSGVLKNAIDHASRPYGQNAWAHKPAGILSASIGAIGGAMAQQHLRNILAYLDVPAFMQPEAYLYVGDGFFAADGSIAKPETKTFLQTWIDGYFAWLKDVLG